MERNKILFTLILCTALAGAGEVKVNTPKSQPDLRATRQGDKVTLTWRQTYPIANLRICRSISSAPSDPEACAQTIGEISAAEHLVRRKSNGEFIDTLPAAEQSSTLQFAVYRLELRDARGQLVGFSNAASVPLAPVLPANGLHSELDARGVYLIWENEIEGPSPSFKFDYRIYRREKGSSNRVAIPFVRGVIHTREGERWSGVDTNIEWEKTYWYSVAPVTRVYSQDGQLIGEVEGADSPALQITTHNVFPPDAPQGLLVLVTQRRSEKFVDLLWAPNVEKDISGYNIYRRSENGQQERISSVPMTMRSFQDANVEAAHAYFYSISAVDKRGNESPKSQEMPASLH